MAETQNKEISKNTVPDKQPTVSVNNNRSSSLTIVLFILLAAASAAGGFYLWQDQQSSLTKTIIRQLYSATTTIEPGIISG